MMKSLFKLSVVMLLPIFDTDAAEPKPTPGTTASRQAKPKAAEPVVVNKEEFALSAFRNQRWCFFCGYPFSEKYREWFNIDYGMGYGVETEAKSNEPIIIGLSFGVKGLGKELDRGPGWLQSVKQGKVPPLDYFVSFPIIRVGDIIPLTNGMLFRVMSLDDASDTAMLERVSAEEFSGAPAVSKNCRIIPFGYLPFSGPGMNLGANYSNIRAKDLHHKQKVIDPISQAEVERDVIQIDLFRWPPGGGSILSKSTEEMAIVLNITVGSIIQVGGVEYTVRNIVLPDPEKQIIGWVELEMPPFDEAKEAEAWKKEQEMWKERWGPVKNP